MSLLDGFVATYGPPRSVERRFAHQCPGDVGSDGVVGLTSAVTFAAPLAASRCEVVAQVEMMLEADGWVVRSLDNPRPDGSGFGGETDASRGRARLSTSVEVGDHLIYVTVEHDGDSEAGAFPAGFPRSECH